MSLIHLDDQEPGPVALSPRRFVYWSGKVAIGLRHEPRYIEQGAHALMFQRLLTTEVPREWHPAPRQFYVSPSWWRRALHVALALALAHGSNS